ncbi:MBL fold metallo-hydrolase [Maricaulaceae bacterium EIL42A08]|nr:MBL fold metallo-hydrolase [Maricaulaceae bacterium EIL42A08]
MTHPDVQAVFDPQSYTISYVVACPVTRECAIIDPVLDFDMASGRTAQDSAKKLIAIVEENDLTPTMILETHVHADHISAAPWLKQRFDCPIIIGAAISETQKTFAPIYALESEISGSGAEFDRLLADGEAFNVGTVEAKALHTPGHTPACMTYVIGDAAFVGDTLFMPDFGTARCDFPGGCARQLYQSIQKLFALPDETRLFMCHDYKAPGRSDYAWETTVGEQKSRNIHVGGEVSEDDFVTMRTRRDAQLGTPKLMLPSVQTNIRAGKMPGADGQGRVFLKLPIDAL